MKKLILISLLSLGLIFSGCGGENGGGKDNLSSPATTPTDTNKTAPVVTNIPTPPAVPAI